MGAYMVAFQKWCKNKTGFQAIFCQHLKYEILYSTYFFFPSTCFEIDNNK